MDTLIIEILRNDQTKTQYLQQGSNYIALCGAEPAKDFVIPCTQEEFDKHTKLLRYNETDDSSRQNAIKFIQSLITEIITQIFPEQLAKKGKSDFLHLRLVTTPKEIAQLPFEMALTPKQLEESILPKPFFINPQMKTTFTREVRQVFFSHYFWPIKPRILFVWAQPNNQVPHEKHLEAFVKVLKPWSLPMKTFAKPIPDLAKLISIVKNVSLDKIQEFIRVGIETNHPYTHVHILAHGGKKSEISQDSFQLVLNDNDGTAHYVTGEELANALIVKINDTECYPPIVSLIACDSGNIGSPIYPTGSLAHHLHQRGIPCVFASQFPLSQSGSVELVTALYTRLLQTSDPRIALYDTRYKLVADKTHDWASLVAYARFPDDITTQMKQVELKVWQKFIETANGLADHINKNITEYSKEEVDTNFKEVEQRFDLSIESLIALLEKYQNLKLNKELYAEHCGLIGSAYKRKAENNFNIQTYYKREPSLFEESTNLLRIAKDWYYKGYKYLNSHWNGTQYLSLTAVLDTGTISNKNYDIWNLCRIMAENDEINAFDETDKAWAYSTLAELYLIEPFFIDKNQKELEKTTTNVKNYLLKLKESPEIFPKESTKRQFKRYINWWVNTNTKLKSLEDIVSEYIELIAIPV